MVSGVGWTLADSESRNLTTLISSYGFKYCCSYLSVRLRSSMGSSSKDCGMRRLGFFTSSSAGAVESPSFAVEKMSGLAGFSSGGEDEREVA